MFAAKCAASIGLAALTASAGIAPAWAQITIDGSLPGTTAGAVPLVGGTYTIPHTSGLLIGTKNLFHSFGQFSIGTGHTADFTGPGTIQNILSRVTGGSRSDILGQIKSSIAGANLYLMNPAGILFGPDSSINVSGAFHATTSSYIKFADGTRFTAAPGPTDSMLTIADPTAFGFLGPGAGAITINGSKLAGKTMSFVGGSIDAHPSGPGVGEDFNVAADGTLNLFTLQGAGEIGLDGTPPAILSGTTQITGKGAFRSNASDGQSTVKVVTGNLSMFGDSATSASALLSADNTTAFDSNGVLSIKANSIRVEGVAKITSETGGSAGNPFGKGVDIVIDTGDLSLVNGGQVTSRVFFASRAGNITVNASGAVTIDGVGGVAGNVFAGIYSDTGDGLTGNAGTSSITANSLTLANGGTISSTTNGDGMAAATSIVAGQVMLSGGSSIQAATSASGNAGNIFLQAASLDLSGASKISTTSEGGASGNAGTIMVTTTGALTIFGTGSSIQSEAQGTGNAGNVTVNANTLTVFGDGEISTSTFGPGSAGTVMVTANMATLATGGTISSSTFDVGDAGTVTVNAGSLLMTGGGNITTTSFDSASGKAGNIFVTVPGAITMTDANSFIQSQALGTGNAGNIVVAAGTLNILKDAGITTDTSTNANAGTIVVNVTGDMLIDGTGHVGFVTGITSDALPADDSDPGASIGNAGSVTVTANNLTLRNNAAISSNTNTNGNAGSVTVVVPGTLLIDGTVRTLPTDYTAISSVANNDLGVDLSSKAGNVSVTAGSLVLLTNGQILADTYTNGDAGTITVNAGTLYINGSGQSVTTGIISDTFVGDGRAGNVTVNAGYGLLINASKIATETGAAGDGGNIVATFGTLDMSGGASISSTSTDKGNAGSVLVGSPGIITLMGANTTIQSRATGTGEAGPVTILAGQLVLKDGASVTTEATIGGGGNISMNIDFLLYLLNSSITTTVAGGSGSGGDIFIDPEFVVLNNSKILAQAFAGNGGNITIIAKHFLQSNDSLVDASSALGISGQISISSPEADIISGTVNLPTGLGSEAKLDQRACVGPGETPVLSLVPVGRGGLALIPDADLADPAFLVAGQDAAAPRTSALPGAALAQFAALPMAASGVNCVR